MRVLGVFLLLIALCAILVAGSGPASAACPLGYGVCPSGTCAPLGSVCCGNGTHCAAGHVCTNDGRCLSTSSARYCGGGSYCPQGYVCTSDGKCRSASASPGGNTGGGNSGHGGGTVSSGCLSVEYRGMRRASGQCSRSDGGVDYLHSTRIQSSGAYGCPTSFLFEYFDPGSGRMASLYTPFTLLTCGKPSNFRVAQ